MRELLEEMIQFKKVTIEVLGAVQQDQFSKLDDLLDSRQKVIENMEKLQYTTEEFTNICNELDILNIQKELLELMKQKKEETKQELTKIQLTKNANDNYNKSFYTNASMFNKQI